MRLRARLRDARNALLGWIERHVAGEDPLAASTRLKRSKLPVSAGYFQAESASPAEVAAAYRRLAAGLAGSGRDAMLALKAPALGFDQDLVRGIASAGLPLSFDSLTEPNAERTLALAEAFAAGAALPERWRRSPSDAQRLRDGPCRVRLVKGEWREPKQTFPTSGTHTSTSPGCSQVERPPWRWRLTIRHSPGDSGYPCVSITRFGPGWWPYAVDKALGRPYLPIWALKDWLGV